jgi:hypothetical protein
MDLVCARRKSVFGHFVSDTLYASTLCARDNEKAKTLEKEGQSRTCMHLFRRRVERIRINVEKRSTRLHRGKPYRVTPKVQCYHDSFLGKLLQRLVCLLAILFLGSPIIYGSNRISTSSLEGSRFNTHVQLKCYNNIYSILLSPGASCLLIQCKDCGSWAGYDKGMGCEYRKQDCFRTQSGFLQP